MTLRTLFKYLIGDRTAILRVAQSPQAIWIGLLFVLAAGFAREYDGEDLVHEPWHLLLPLAASLITSFLLYSLVRLVARCRGASEPGFFTGYRSFLGLYWMTAPLALLYGIPFERFLSAGNAMVANLWLLGIIAAWRVLLITRVISVVYAASYTATWFPVMLFADTVLLAAIAVTPRPLFMVMGGVRLSEAEGALLGTTLLVGFFGYASWLVWLIGSLVVAIARGSRWSYQVEGAPAFPASKGVWTLAIASLVLWAVALPFTQPQQMRRRQVERLFKLNRITEALLAMSAYHQGEFPPHWDPPPRLSYERPHPDVMDVQEAANQLDLRSWVRDIFNAKFVEAIRQGASWRLDEIPATEVERRLGLIEALETGEFAIDDELQFALERLAGRGDLSSELRTRVNALLERTSKSRPADDADADKGQ